MIEFFFEHFKVQRLVSKQQKSKILTDEIIDKFGWNENAEAILLIKEALRIRTIGSENGHLLKRKRALCFGWISS